MYTRIKEIRNLKKLNQADFGKNIGLSRDTIANIEGNRIEIKDAFVKLICKEYHVNETWLRTGEGDMFTPKSMEEELIAFTGDLLLGEESFKKRLISALAKLSEEQWDLLEGIIDEISQKRE